MRKLTRISLTAIGVVVALLVLVFGWIQTTWNKSYDDLPYPPLRASTDSAVIAHGRYLVRGPAHCSICHMGSLDEVKRSDAGEDLPLRGGLEISIGPIAVLHSANLTPDSATGIGRYTDGQMFRMLRHNVRPNGHASIAPLMPFAHMADDDLVAIVSYLRSMEPVRHEVPTSHWTLMGKTIAALLRPAAFRPVVGQTVPTSAPPQEATVERGEYLANYVANCKACHSKLDQATGELRGPAFAGDATGERSDLDHNVLLRPPNLTPDPTGALVRFPTEEAWVARFRGGRLIPESIMPWGPFSRMSEEDLRAIYRYLHSLDPVTNDVGPTVEHLGG